jgi:hypothetical protein
VSRRFTLEALETRNLLSTLTVTNPLDTGVSGDGSLRGEIAAAASGDQILFADGLAGLTITLDPTNGPLVLRKDLTIGGPGADCLTVSGNNVTEVFCVASGATDCITGLTIANGNADGGSGGGITDCGTLTLDHVTLCGNHADCSSFHGGGGGIFNLGALTIDHSTLCDNHADDANAGGGGGILNGGTLTIDHSTLSGNHADRAFAGGDSTFAGGGGAILNLGTLTIDHTDLSDNHADDVALFGGGGGILNGGTLTIDHSTLSGNHADRAFAGGDIAFAGGGGAILNSGTLTIRQSALLANHADCGGGIFNDASGTVTLEYSAVVGNQADGGEGGGVFNSGTLTLDYSALVGNSASFGADLANLAGTVTLINSKVGERADG